MDLKVYSSFKPTAHDSHIHVDKIESWLVAPVSLNRDSDILTRSNYNVVKADIAKHGEQEEDYEEHTFGHWACGWFSIFLVRPGSKCADVAVEWAKTLSDYPVADEDNHSELQEKDAQETWENCYNNSGRIDYIRKHRYQFEFSSFADMVACVRGKAFYGYASELV